MSHQIVPLLQNILLVARLSGSIVMNDIGNSMGIPSVRDDPNVGFEDHNIATLPRLMVRKVCGQFHRVALEIDPQIPDPAKINVRIRLCDPIGLRRFRDIIGNQRHQIIPRRKTGIGHHIRAHAIGIVGIATVIIFALVFRFCFYLV